MKFDEHFKNSLLDQMYLNRDSLKKSMREQVANNKHEIYYLPLALSFCKFLPAVVDIETAFQLIESTFSRPDFIEYLNNIHGIIFNIEKSDKDIETVNSSALEMKKHNNEIDTFIEKYLIDFWTIRENYRSTYLSFSNFSCFENLLIKKEDYTQYGLYRNYSNLNVNDWKEFFKNIFTYVFNDYEIDRKSNNDTVRFIKKIGKSFLAIEYSIKSLSSILERGILRSPLAKLVIFSSDFERTSSYKNTIEQEDKNKMTLGNFEFGFPFNTSKIESFFTSKMFSFTEVNGTFEIINRVKIVESDVDYSISCGDYEGEEIKEYSFIYLNTQLEMQKKYVDYMEECVRDVVS